MKASEFVLKLADLITAPTCYATGGFGAVVNLYNNRARYVANTKSKDVKLAIRDAKDGTFLFDCIGLGKSILWDFSQDVTKRYGGAEYKAHDIPDFAIKSIPKYGEFHEEMVNILPAEWLITKNQDHVAYYIGGGMYIDISQKNDGFKVTVHNSLNDREWYGHCKMQWIEYGEEISTIKCPYCGKDILISVV